MPYIDQANIACGGHAGDANSVSRTVKLALENRVAIGAHPSYPDKENFGRSHQNIPAHQLIPILREQIKLVADCHPLHHIKAHGALYNDSTDKPELIEILAQLAAEFKCKLMLQAFPHMQHIEHIADKYKIEWIGEGFADRAYSDDGRLLSRKIKGAVYNDVDAILDQAKSFISGRDIRTHSGNRLTLNAQSLCVHGDNPIAFEALSKIRHALN